MDMTDLATVKRIIPQLLLKDDDLVWGIFMPDKDCDLCGSFGVKEWDDNGDSVLCECLVNDNKIIMNYGLLNKLSILTKEEVYNE